MARTKSLNFGKLNSELFDADAAINPLLAVSKITEITVNGKPVPSSDAPLADRINALARVNPPQADSQPASFAIEANAALSQENEELQADSVRHQATIAQLTQENAQLRQERDTANANVQTLTAGKAQLQNQLDAAIAQYSGQAAIVSGFNEALTEQCLAAGCLTLVKDGKALPGDAKDEDKKAVALAIPWKEKMTAYNGAVHSAVARVGVNIKNIPATANGSMNLSQRNVLAEYEKQDPKNKMTYYRANKAAIDAAYRSMRD